MLFQTPKMDTGRLNCHPRYTKISTKNARSREDQCLTIPGPSKSSNAPLLLRTLPDKRTYFNNTTLTN
jgi:hypothetical protein